MFPLFGLIVSVTIMEPGLILFCAGVYIALPVISVVDSFLVDLSQYAAII